ncbi:MAG: hypothetical protein R6V04_02810 [bacterium]
MGVANIEKNIYDRVIVQLKGINGSGNYNFNIQDSQIYEKFKMPSEVAPDRGRPILCMGEQRIATSEGVRRGEFEYPYSLEVWGYAKHSSDTWSELNKLISDVRIALAGAEHLNDLVTEFGFQVSSGIDTATGVGVMLFLLKGNACYDTDA